MKWRATKVGKQDFYVVDFEFYFMHLLDIYLSFADIRFMRLLNHVSMSVLLKFICLLLLKHVPINLCLSCCLVFSSILFRVLVSNVYRFLNLLVFASLWVSILELVIFYAYIILSEIIYYLWTTCMRQNFYDKRLKLPIICETACMSVVRMGGGGWWCGQQQWRDAVKDVFHRSWATVSMSWIYMFWFDLVSMQCSKIWIMQPVILSIMLSICRQLVILCNSCIFMHFWILDTFLADTWYTLLVYIFLYIIDT